MGRQVAALSLLVAPSRASRIRRPQLHQRTELDDGGQASQGWTLRQRSGWSPAEAVLYLDQDASLCLGPRPPARQLRTSYCATREHSTDEFESDLVPVLQVEGGTQVNV